MVHAQPDMEHRSSKTHQRHASFESELEVAKQVGHPPGPVAIGSPSSRRKNSVRHSHQHPKPPPTPNTAPASMPQPMPNPLLPSAPASPPTPAPSPTPHQRVPTWNIPSEDIEDSILRDARLVFSRLSISDKETWLASMLDTCDNHLLSYVHQLVSPRLKKDPFLFLPNEICFKVAIVSKHSDLC